MTVHTVKKYTAGIIALAFIIVSTQTTQAATAADGQQLDIPQGSNASLNWSGYVAGGSGSDERYTSVSGSWVVPSVTADTLDSADATWVGIGGVQTRDLVQAGTQALVQDGAVTYNAWIEMLPGFSKTVALQVHPGDSITTALTEESPGQWLITIDNNTTGKHFSTTVAYDSSHSSAEWVEEMVSNGNGTFRPLDSFGKVAFTNAAVTVNGTRKNLSDLETQPLQMTSRGGQTLAVASALTDNGFSVSRSDTSAATIAEQYTDEFQVPVTITVIPHRHGGIPVTFTIVGL